MVKVVYCLINSNQLSPNVHWFQGERMSLGLCPVKQQTVISKQMIDRNFEDLHKPFNLLQAKHEASNCLYCFDAPCINACPTSIDIPTFIHQIRSDNVIGSAKTILSQNIMAGTCARACPTEVLCEQACVLNASEQQPVKIGDLQRFAVDHLFEQQLPHPFNRAALSGQSIAVIGAGPAGLACAHKASMLGHKVTIYEAKPKAGGLNEYGLAAYKMVDDFAQKEIEFLLGIGGITLKYGQQLASNSSLSSLQQEYDAVFIGIGLYKTNKLGIEGEDGSQIINAIDFIEQLRQAKDKSELVVGENVLVIGAGNTAIDAAIQSKRLGAKTVNLVYRRGEESMSATQWEIDLARQNSVNCIFWSAPKSFLVEEDNTRMIFERTKIENNKLVATGEEFSLTTDMVLTAIGQKLDQSLVPELNIEQGKIVVSDDYETSMKAVFAGGDCIASGVDLTVQAVEDGKQAAYAIDRYLIDIKQVQGVL